MHGRCVGHVYFFLWELKVTILMIQRNKSFIQVEEVFLWGLYSFLITCTSPPLSFLLHFLCVYLPFRFHSHLFPCLGINNITICCNKIQVTCFIIIIIIISYLWFFWRWCTNDGDYNSNTYIVIVHDLIRHLSLLFSPSSHEVSHMWLDDCSFSFRIETKADLNFIKSKRKFIWNFCMKKGFFNLRCVVFYFRSCLQGTLLTSKPQFNRKHNGEN